MTAHLLVMYPTPKDPKAFDRAYREEHLPYAAPPFDGRDRRRQQTSRLHARGERPPYHAISDVSFPSLEVLQRCAASPGGKEALAHAASISTGGAPVVMVVTDDLALS